MASGCAGGTRPGLKVLGVEQSQRLQVVFVQVTNPARHAMRLQRLEYSFASSESGSVVQRGELALGRDVEGGAAIVVEVPLEISFVDGPMTLKGNLIAELDKMTRVFPISATVTAAATTPTTPAPADDAHDLRHE